MNKFILFSAFLFLILCVTLTANYNATTSEDQVQFISATTAGMTDMQIVNNDLQVLQMIECTMACEQNISSNHVNQIITNNVTEKTQINSLVITEYKNSANANNLNQAHGISIISENYGSMNNFINVENLNSSFGKNNATDLKTRVDDFGSINKLSTSALVSLNSDNSHVNNSNKAGSEYPGLII